MTLLKSKTKRQNRIDKEWWINDRSSKDTSKFFSKVTVRSQELSSSIILKSNEDSISMVKTKNFIRESLNSSKGINGTIIIGSVSSDKDVPELHEILLNIQPLGWIYIPGGSKDEKQ